MKTTKIKTGIEVQSPQGQLNSFDWKKIGKGALIAFGGAFLLSIGEWLTTGNVELWKPALGAALSVGINAVWKLLQGN